MKLQYGHTAVHIYPSRQALGEAAALAAAAMIQEAIGQRGYARIMIATGNSQLDVSEALVRQNIDWQAVDVFHMDEYVGIPAAHPSSFRRWIKTRIVDQVHPRSIHYLQGDAQDLSSEIERYAKLLESEPVDLAFVGFGENGHIAFNDPPTADFEDPDTVKRVQLDEACRMQQAGEGHFPHLDSVPREALTVTCSALLRIAHWVSCVPEGRKASAVQCALKGPISNSCPASAVRLHPDATVYLDLESSKLLESLGGTS